MCTLQYFFIKLCGSRQDNVWVLVSGFYKNICWIDRFLMKLMQKARVKAKKIISNIKRRLLWKANVDGVEFINFSCLKIEQNHTSSCSLPVITYESILGFSYKSSFFMQIRLKKVLLAVLLLKNLAKYNKEINMTVKFLLITFKQSCVIICC